MPHVHAEHGPAPRQKPRANSRTDACEGIKLDCLQNCGCGVEAPASRNAGDEHHRLARGAAWGKERADACELRQKSVCALHFHNYGRISTKKRAGSRTTRDVMEGDLGLFAAGTIDNAEYLLLHQNL